MNRFIRIALATALLCLGAWAEDRPPAPAGFTWFDVPETKAGFLQPNGWAARVDRRDGFVAYSFSSQAVSPATCSISVISGGGPVEDPVKRVSDFVQGMQLVSMPVGEVEKPSTLGPFHTAGGTFIEKDSPDGAHQSYMKIVVNPKTGTTYIVGFETLASAWDEAWKTGRVCVGLFTLDDED